MDNISAKNSGYNIKKKEMLLFFDDRNEKQN